jgi:transcriptional regulator with XRE-family HTH domain
MDLGKKLFELRKSNGLSQEDLAEKLKVSRQTISKWELNETSPDLKQAKELSGIFKVGLDELVNNDVSNIIIEKISNTERLAQLTIKIIKAIGILIAVAIVLGIIYSLFHTEAWFVGEGRQFKCSLGKESYNIEIWSYNDGEYSKNKGYKNYWSCPNCNLEQLTNIKKYINYNDLNETQVFINAYFESLGGTCK